MVLSNSGRSDFRGVTMVHKIGVALTLAGMLAAAYGEDDSKPVYKPLAFGGFSEFGMLQSGQYGNNKVFSDEWVNHFGAYIAQTVNTGDDLAFDIGLGGVFEYQKREVVQAQWGGSQYKNFFIGPSVADIRWKAAARDGQGLGFQFGMFDYKYNEDASNLGEYLFRSGTYPVYVTSGGLWFMNKTSVQLQALRAGYNRGALTSDFFLITETSMPSLYDLSAAAVVGYKFADGLVDLGAGVNFKHMIPVKPSRTSPHISSNAYFTKDGETYTGYDAYYYERSNFYKRRMTEDPANAATYQALASADSLKGSNVKLWLANPDSAGIDPKYYTQQGLITMARASVDFKKLIGSELFGPNDLRLYAEAAILGVQNYPFYYEKITERMPIMAGFNFPGFKFIDLISIQAEYFNSPNLNSYWELVRSNSAVPTTPNGSDVTRSKTEYGDITKNDNLSWSILAKKTFGRASYISAQVARDHLRTVSIDTWTAPEPVEVLGRSSDWYWMLQFGYGI
ncbi:MAG: hypothetical protein JWO30_1354 [Fibrobacteres bacterium]|nr:hypothetical protein [Fibrobacterota bacterium]